MSKARGPSRIAVKRVLGNRKLFHFLLRRAYLAQKPVSKGQYLRHLPFFLFQRAWVPQPACGGQDAIEGHVGTDQSPFGKAPVPCGALRRMPGGFCLSRAGPNSGASFKDHNVQLEYPMEQTCCGLPAMMMGENETARETAVQNLKAIDPANFDFVLTLCASCGSHLKENYPKLCGEDEGVGVKVRQLQG